MYIVSTRLIMVDFNIDQAVCWCLPGFSTEKSFCFSPFSWVGLWEVRLAPVNVTLRLKRIFHFWCSVFRLRKPYLWVCPGVGLGSESSVCPSWWLKFLPPSVLWMWSRWELERLCPLAASQMLLLSLGFQTRYEDLWDAFESDLIPGNLKALGQNN